MTKISKLFLFAIAITTTACATHAKADWYQRINRQATLLEGQAKELTQQTKYYKNASNYSQLVSETREIVDLAKNLKSESGKRGRLTYIENDLAELDRRYERLERRLESSKTVLTSRGGTGQGRLRYVTSLMQSIENSIDSIQAEARKMRAAYEADRQQQLQQKLALEQQRYLNSVPRYYAPPVVYQTQYVPTTYVPTYTRSVVTAYPRRTYVRPSRVPTRGRALPRTSVYYNTRSGRGGVRVGGARIGF